MRWKTVLKRPPVIDTLQALVRFVQLIRTLARFRLEDLLPKPPPLWLRLGLGLFRLGAKPLGREHSAYVRLRLAMESQGPVMVKFGQALSTRHDLLPLELANELSLLQDKVAPFPAEQAVACIESSLQQPLEALFAEFERQPMAAASIAQVHAARLHDGAEVVVKVLRPGVSVAIRRDMEMLYALASLVNLALKDASRFRMKEAVREFDLSLRDELDLQREAANASQMRRNFSGSELLYIPKVYFDYTRRQVMVQERIYGLPCTAIERFEKAGVVMETLAERAVEIAFTQIFRDNFFHADMHPGNIFVDISNPAKPRYLAVDFGIVGSLSEDDREYLAETLLGFFNQDYQRVAKIHIDRGFVAADTRLADFEAAIRTISEPIMNKPLAEISFGQVLMQVLQTTQRFEMEVQPSLLLLDKTLFQIEGLGRQIYPELDLWKTAKPILERWDIERRGPGRLFKELQKLAPQVAAKLPHLPRHALEAMEQLAAQGAHQRGVHQELLALRQHLQAQQRLRQRQLKAGFGLALGLAWLQWGSAMSVMDLAAWLVIGVSMVSLLTARLR